MVEKTRAAIAVATREFCGVDCQVRARKRAESERANAPVASLITLRERIRLDEIGRLIDQLVLAIEFGPADAGLGPEVMIFMDTDVAFRGTLELDPRGSRSNLVDIEAAGLLRG